MASPVKCSDCGHWIKPESPYWARKKGPRCGGRIRRTRKPATAPAPTHLPVGAAFDPEYPGQIPLFEILIVRVPR